MVTEFPLFEYESNIEKDIVTDTEQKPLKTENIKPFEFERQKGENDFDLQPDILL